MKVLMIDDDPDALTLVRARLTPEGLEITGRTEGGGVLAQARRDRPDLILLDVNMPDVSGFELCRQLKAEPELRLTPVIFVSAAAETEDKVRGLDQGAVDYITKPFDAFELRARVRAALRTKHLQDLLQERAHVDELTGIPNRRGLMDRLRREWARVGRAGGVLALVMADIDRFKEINDRYGHPVGDRMLQAVARAIASQCRDMDLPARYGGEEFAIVVPDATTEDAMRLAERCRQNVASVSIRSEGQDVQATASFGVTDSRGVTGEENLIKDSDHALYNAKKAGRNAVVAK